MQLSLVIVVANFVHFRSLLFGCNGNYERDGMVGRLLSLKLICNYLHVASLFVCSDKLGVCFSDEAMDVVESNPTENLKKIILRNRPSHQMATTHLECGTVLCS